MKIFFDKFVKNKIRRFQIMMNCKNRVFCLQIFDRLHDFLTAIMNNQVRLLLLELKIKLLMRVRVRIK